MTSLNACVQEFIAHHSSALFPHDNADNRHSRTNRFASVPGSSSVVIEDEDPDLYVITPPIEHFLRVSSRLCREQFFKLIRPGHLLICSVLTASSRDLLARILCFDDGRRRALHDLKLTATCLLNSSHSASNSHYNNHPSRKNKYDRDLIEINDDHSEEDDGEYQNGDLIRACVIHVDIHKEEIQLTVDQSATPRHSSNKKLGIINEDDLPRHYVLLRRQAEQPQSYQDILHTSKAFNNRACVQTLYQRLRQRYEHVHAENSGTELPLTPPLSGNTDILHMTLIKSFKRKQIPSDEYFDKLRQKQDRAWAMESVTEGIRLMKDDQSSSAVLNFNKALSLDPTCVDALVARGALLANQGHYKRSMQDFEEALKLDRHHANAVVYLHDVLNNMASEAKNYDDAIDYLEKALKYKPDAHETRRKLDALRVKKKEAAQQLEYGPTLPSHLQTSSRSNGSSKRTPRRDPSMKGSSSSHSHKNGSKRKRRSSSNSTTSQSSSSSCTSSSSSSSTSNDSLSTISSSSDKKKKVPVIDLTTSTASKSSTDTRIRKSFSLSFSSTTTNIPSSANRSKSIIDLTTTTAAENHQNGQSFDFPTVSRSRSDENPSRRNELLEQRKTLPSTVVVSSSSSSSTVKSKKQSKDKSSLAIDKEAEDIEKLYMELKAKQMVEKRKK